MNDNANFPPLFSGRIVEYVRDLAATVDSKSDYFPGHSVGVAHIAGMIVVELGMDQRIVQPLQVAALLHDVGKIRVPDSILLSPHALTQDEWKVMHQHSLWSAEIAAGIGDLSEDVVSWILHHHEHVDGSGYPDGLQGDQIPWQSRLLLVADAYHVMTAVRPYRSAMTRTEAAALLREKSGEQFDPVFVSAIPE